MVKPGSYSLKFTDALLAAALILISVIPVFSVMGSEPSKKTLVITSSGNKKEYSLEKNTDIKINNVVFRVVNGTVRAVSASCPEQICVNTGAISKNGSSIICAHNRVIAEIRGVNENSDVNAVAY